MGSQSTIFTIGTLLSRAESAEVQLRILVDGHWISGIPVVSDGHGVIIDSDEAGHVLVRIEAISAIFYSRSQVTQVPTPRAEQNGWHTPIAAH